MFRHALLFDLDGTLIDSNPFHLRAFREIGQRYGVTVTEEVFRDKISGQSNAEICRVLFPHVEEALHPAIADEKEALFRSLLSREAQAVAGLPPLLEWARERGWGVALVTNAPRANADHMLDAIAVTDRFHATVAAEDVARGKPDPLPYRTALDRLGVPAAAAVAFEDAVPGLSAAVAAGIPTIGLSTTMDADALLAAGAALAVPDFRDPALRRFILDRFGG
ncbi:HAD family hydrolase [Azospirillum sp. ST 5-10]|uniref:HAD family hydrolase n=1 Tax=unclassified Azospirillum TaxID=2630922 RepID=UPI003F4A854D